MKTKNLLPAFFIALALMAQGANAGLCKESDDGINYYFKGVLSYRNETFEDSCVNATHLIEYYCMGNSYSFSIKECENSCFNGACTIEWCMDEDGKDYYTASKTYTWRGYFGDACNGNEVVEYFCNGSEVENMSFPCTYGCENGRCRHRSEVCIDSDGGKDFSIKGAVEFGNKVAVDMCLDEKRLLEFYCESNEVKKVIYLCRRCSNGTCEANDMVTGFFVSLFGKENFISGVLRRIFGFFGSP